eukprot:TRINITY_DN2083_c0_g1_i2.p4 TRINITY_DN2083_c0_g1~~TRINITY_DN2083_c0_g1_i2.p4  ORF type:complete len:122 (-),score=36.14 TRINITY_DN2083_c0_g1_i2:1608-1973(-)
MSGEYTADEVAKHNKATDLWLIFEGKVYDVSKFVAIHPGGDQILLSAAGEDATEVFEEIGHSDDAYDQRDEYCIGTLVEKKSETKEEKKEEKKEYTAEEVKKHNTQNDLWIIIEGKVYVRF